MSSLNTLKHDILVAPSFYRGAALFAFYCLPLILLAFIFSGWFVYNTCFALACLAFYLARKECQIHFSFTVSEAGDLELFNKDYLIKSSSFFNSWFLYLSLDHKKSLIENKPTKPSRLILFKYSISDLDYLLLARLINQA